MRTAHGAAVNQQHDVDFCVLPGCAGACAVALAGAGANLSGTGSTPV
ncbi:hypothetical protein [Streptomyces thermolineatus]